MRWAIFLLFVTIFIANSCKSPKKKFVKDIQPIPATQLSATINSPSPCNVKSNYIPDPDYIDHTPVRLVKVNFHFMRNDKGKGNFSEKDGIRAVSEYLTSANGSLRNNRQMNLPIDNDTPIVPTRFQYVLTPDPTKPGDDGIYFHNDDDYYFIINKGKFKNNYDREVFAKYGVQKKDVLNIFIQDHHLDSLNSKTYKTSMNGIAFETWVKCSMWYTNDNDPNRKWVAPKQLNHEIGHVFGLLHTWRGNDGCDDTPLHNNCWNVSNRGGCEIVSNNVMDYNATRNAWTPCQLGIVHQSMTQNKVKRNLLIPNWCELREDKTIFITDKIEWNSCKDLRGHIVIEDGGELSIRCRVSLPKNAKIIVAPKGKLILDGGRLHNDCGDQWQGIEVWSRGSNQGEVVYANQATIENTINQVNFVEKPSSQKN